MTNLLKTNICSCTIVFKQRLFLYICFSQVITNFDMICTVFFDIYTIFLIGCNYIIYYITLLLLNQHCVSIFAFCIYFDIVKIFLYLFFFVNKVVTNFSDIIISSQLHSICSHLQLHSQSSHQSLSNLFLLSVAT